MTAKRFFLRVVLAVVLYAGCGSSAARELEGSYSGNFTVANFQKVSPELWRGAAPSPEQLHQLATSGVKTVIDLRRAGQLSMKEKALAGQLGINYFNIPLSYFNPSMDTINSILTIVTNPANQPVFVHCRQGADRTGTLVAIYRMLAQGWPFAKAYEEMREHHFKPWLIGLKHAVTKWEPEVKQEDMPVATAGLKESL